MIPHDWLTDIVRVEHYCHIDAAGLPLDVLLERISIVHELKSEEKSGSSYDRLLREARKAMDKEDAAKKYGDVLEKPILETDP